MSFTKFVKVITNQSPSGLFSYRIYKELLVPKEKEKILNVQRLIRSAMTDEDYCSFILDCLHEEQSKFSLERLNKFWGDAAKSSDTVEEWINNHRGK